MLEGENTIVVCHPRSKISVDAAIIFLKKKKIGGGSATLKGQNKIKIK